MIATLRCGPITAFIVSRSSPAVVTNEHSVYESDDDAQNETHRRSAVAGARPANGFEKRVTGSFTEEDTRYSITICI